MDDVVYKVDRADTIVDVNPAWDRFAAANATADLVGARVVGRSLWEFVGDRTSRELYQRLLAQVRGGDGVRFALRCDSPDRRRRLEMNISAEADDRVEFRTRELASEPRTAQALLDPTAAHDDSVVLSCSWCNRIDADGRWLEVEDAVRELGLFERPRLPRLSHVICPDCFTRVSLALDG